MLIIPVEKEINWRKPPWITLSLILLNCLVYFLWQSDDQKLTHQAIETYLASGLAAQDAPAYETYLGRRIAVDGEELQSELLFVRQTIEKGDIDDLAPMMVFDPYYADYVRTQWQIFWTQAEFDRWQAVYTPIEVAYLSQRSTQRAGLIPRDLSVSDLITYQFLHGGFGHLFGNMLFLFLIGFAVEYALGPVRFLLAYLLTGIFSGLCHAAFDAGGAIPLVGASGAISGVMGMYVAIFGLRRIRFFYFLGPYFDYFQAPALAVLPVWLGKEILDYWLADGSGVAYLAHAGGLASGAALVWIFGKSWMQVREEFFAPTDDEAELQYRKAYGQAMAELGRFEFDQSERRFEVLQSRYPERAELAEHLYQLAKRNPANPVFATRGEALIIAAAKRGNSDLAMQVYDELCKLGGDSMSFDHHSRIYFICLREQKLKDADKVLQRMRALDGGSVTQEAARLLITEYRKHQQEMKARQWQGWLDQQAQLADPP